ncbi:MAG TPA: hypothetical protein V6D18_19505 [Thermosynechococcaceae cyanobacterium]|jgi:hypothetical protein
MNKLTEFLQDPNGEFSSTRLAFLAWIFAVLIGWGVDTARHDYKMAQIPESVQVLIGVLMSGKVVQRFGEKPISDSAELEITQKVKTTEANNTALPLPGKVG